MDLWRAFMQVPAVTRSVVAAAAAVSLGSAAGLVQPHQLVNVWAYSVGRGQLWRIAAALVYAGAGLPMLVALAMLLHYSAALERAPLFAGAPARYAACLALVAVAVLGASLLTGAVLYLQALLFAIVALWAQQHPAQPVAVFAVRMQARLLPYVMLALLLLTAGPAAALHHGVIGILAAHAYLALARACPAAVQPPSWLSRLVSPNPGSARPGSARPYGTAYAPPAAASGRPFSIRPFSGRPFSGRGHRLGDDLARD